MGIPSCLLGTNKKLQHFIDKKDELNVNVRDDLLCAGMRTATMDQLIALLKLLEQQNYLQFQNSIIMALKCMQDKELLNFAYLQYLLNFINNEYAMISILMTVYQSGPVGMEMVLKFLVNDGIFEKIGNIELLNEMLLDMINYLNNDDSFKAVIK